MGRRGPLQALGQSHTVRETVYLPTPGTPIPVPASRILALRTRTHPALRVRPPQLPFSSSSIPSHSVGRRLNPPKSIGGAVQSHPLVSSPRVPIASRSSPSPFPPGPIIHFSSLPNGPSFFFSFLFLEGVFSLLLLRAPPSDPGFYKDHDRRLHLLRCWPSRHSVTSRDTREKKYDRGTGNSSSPSLSDHPYRQPLPSLHLFSS